MEGSSLKGGHPAYDVGCISVDKMQYKLNNTFIFSFFFFFHGRKSDPCFAFCFLMWVLSFWVTNCVIKLEMC